MTFAAGAVLAVRDLRHELRRDEVLLTLECLDVQPGQLLVLTGPSGSGKSTLLYLLAGLVVPTAGRIAWDGLDLAPLRARDRWRRQRTGFVFQDFHLIPELSPLENVLLPAPFTRFSSRSLRPRAAELLREVGVPESLRTAVLSRGEQQRVALARALLHQPAVVFADEPTASLDAVVGGGGHPQAGRDGPRGEPDGGRREPRPGADRAGGPASDAAPRTRGDAGINPLPVVRASLARNPFTVVLFTGLIAVAVALGIAVSVQERALRQGSARAADRFDLIVAAPGSQTDLLFATVFLRPAAVELLSPGVTARALAEPDADFDAPVAFGDHAGDSPVVGTTAAFVEHLSGGLAEGRPFGAVDEGVVGALPEVPVGRRSRCYTARRPRGSTRTTPTTLRAMTTTICGCTARSP